MTRVAVIDDDPAIGDALGLLLRREGHDVATATTLAAGRELLAAGEHALVFLDVGLPDGSGLDLLRELAPRRDDLAVVMISGSQDMMATIDAIRAGAFDYIRKPLDRDDVLLAIEKARRQTTPRDDLVALPAPAGPHELIGRDKRIVDVLVQIGRLSQSRLTVLIEGETGTGKELVARAIHEATSPEAPFVAINCAAVVETLLASELFGHEQGAFTGAERAREGKLELAGEGTLFLDEIGDMSLDLQATLLRALETRTFERVGGSASRPLGARVIAATHNDLTAAVHDGRFREDLYFRLAVARLELPALRERRADIPLLATHLLARIAAEHALPVEAISHGALEQLAAREWPGNVRELANELTLAATLARDGVVDALPAPTGAEAIPVADAIEPLEVVVNRHVRKALAAHDWNITHTARALGISPTTLRKRIHDASLRRGPAE